MVDARYSPSKLNEDSLHGVFALPLGEARKHGRVDDAVARVDARQVHLADKLDSGRLIGVLLAAVHLDAVDAVLVYGLGKELAMPAVWDQLRTWGGPRMVPFQLLIRRSSPSSRP